MADAMAPVACGHCGEAIAADDERSPMGGVPLHYECGVRIAVGSIAHLERRCSCFVPGSRASDPDDVSPRQAARLVVFAVRQRQPQPGESLVEFMRRLMRVLGIKDPSDG